MRYNVILNCDLFYLPVIAIMKSFWKMKNFRYAAAVAAVLVFGAGTATFAEDLAAIQTAQVMPPAVTGLPQPEPIPPAQNKPVFAPPADLMPQPAMTEEPKILDLPPIPVEPTHPMLRLTMDKSEILNLDVPAKSVIVGSDTHLGVFIDAPQRLVLVPRIPGATYFTVMGENGEVIMQRHAVVATPKEKYVRVRRSCALSEGACNTIQTYYCPDMCHEIVAPGAETSSASVTASTGGEEDAPVPPTTTAGAVPPTTTTQNPGNADGSSN